LAAQCPGHPLKVLALSIDTTDAAEQVKAVFGCVEFIINNAGYMEQFRLIADTDPEEWWKTWTVNVLGMYHVTRTFLPLLIKCGGKKAVINMTSIGTHFLGLQVSVYQVRARQYSCHSVPPIRCYASQTTKLTILQFTELIVAEYSEQGVLAYVVHRYGPGGWDDARSSSTR
jgi:NAD(P)-dependent dehydrogenase (short-subunit alcohol dehydrogenase family)